MTDEAAFIRAICDRPRDDTPRLVYADWLDDHQGSAPCPTCGGARRTKDRVPYGGWSRCGTCSGLGWVPDGRAARAEFIRVQVDLARLPKRHVISERVALTKHGPGYWECPSGAHLDGGEMLVTAANPGDRVDVLARKSPLLGLRLVKFLHDPGERDGRGDAILALDDQSGPDTSGALRRRERELFDRHKSAWFGGDRWAVLLLPDDEPDLLPGLTTAVVRRGFVVELRVPTLDVLFGGECRRCGGTGMSAAPPGDIARAWPCDDCNSPISPPGSEPGRTPGIAAAVFGRHPVTRVEVANKGASETPSGWAWWCHVGLDDTDVLPEWLYHLLPDDDATFSVQGERICYPTRAAALDALSAAIVARGRQLVGLPPLRIS